MTALARGAARKVLGLLALLLAVAGPASAASITVPVQAKVEGFNGTPTIGNIVADGGFAGEGKDPRGLRADFTFAKNFGFLDNHYDFDWVQVLTKQDFTPKTSGGSGSSGLFPNPPNIDQIPQDKKLDKDKPFYCDSKEWFTDNKFAGLQIHSDGQYSRFLDVPKQPADRTFHFLTFLVVRDNGAYTLNGEKEFCVLAGFSWQFQGGGDVGGTSTAIGAVAIGQGVIDILNEAIDSDGALLPDRTTKADPFVGWSAHRDCTLVPEPPTFLLLVLGLGVVSVYAARRQLKRAVPAAA